MYIYVCIYIYIYMYRLHRSYTYVLRVSFASHVTTLRNIYPLPPTVTVPVTCRRLGNVVWSIGRRWRPRLTTDF